MGLSILSSGGAALYPRDAPAPAPRRAAMLTLGLGGLCVAGSLALALPPLLPALQAGPMAVHQVMLLALLGLAGGALALFTGSAAAYLTQAAAAAAVQTIAAASARASEQIGVLGETASGLHRHAAALDSAGIEIARAGAGWITRLGETVGHAETALRQLPEATAAIVQAAEQAAQRLAEATAQLGSDAASLHDFGRESTRAAALLQQDAVALGAMLGSVGQEMTGAAADVVTRLQGIIGAEGLAALAGLPRLTDDIAAAAARLGRDLPPRPADGAAAARIADATAQAETALRRLAGLPDLAGLAATLRDEAASLREAGQGVLASGEATAARLATGLSRIEVAAETTAETSAVAARHCEAALREGSERANTALAGAAAALCDHAATLRDEAAALQAAGRAARDGGAAAASRLAADLARIEASIGTSAEAAQQREATLAGAAETLGRQAAALQSGAGHAARTVAEAAARMTAVAERTAAQTGTALQAVAGWPDLTVALGKAAAAARRQTMAMTEAGRSVTAAGEAAATRLGSGLAGIEAALCRLPDATAALSAAAGDAAGTLAETASVLGRHGDALQASLGAAGRETLHATAALQQEAAFLLAAGREVASGGQDVVARLSETAAQLALTVTAAQIGAAQIGPAEMGAAAMGAAEIGAEARAVLATLPDAVAAMAADLQAGLGAALRAELAAAQAGWGSQAQDLLAAGQSVARAAALAGAALDGLHPVAADIATQAAGLQQEAAFLRLAGRDMASGGSDLVARLSETAQLGAAARAELTAAQAGWGAQAQDLAAAGQSVARAAARAEAALDGLPPVAADLALRAATLQREAASLTATLQEMGGVNAEATSRLAALPAALDAVAAALAAGLDGSVRRLEAAALRTAVSPAIPEPPPHAGKAAPATLAGTLQQLDAVGREAAALLRQAEALAEAVLAGQAPAAPAALAHRTPALLESVDGTIQQLRAAATALALASDGPPPQSRAAA